MQIWLRRRIRESRSQQVHSLRKRVDSITLRFLILQDTIVAGNRSQPKTKNCLYCNIRSRRTTCYLIPSECTIVTSAFAFLVVASLLSFAFRSSSRASLLAARAAAVTLIAPSTCIIFKFCHHSLDRLRNPLKTISNSQIEKGFAAVFLFSYSV